MPPAAQGPRTVQSLNNVPLAFEVNRGQADKRIEFLCRGSGYALLIDSEEAVFNLRHGSASTDTIRMKLAGSNPNAAGEAIDKQRGVVSYFIGNDPSQWHPGVPTYGKVKYANIYPGIDLVFYGNQRQLEYDFVVASGADPSRISWQIEGAQPRIAADGSLDLNALNGPASFKRPLLYQMRGDKKTVVDGAFTVTGNRVGFQVGSYDRSRALIIDPVLVYATYLGGQSAAATDNIGYWNGPGILGNNPTNALAIDSNGSVYVTGYTTSVDFPVSNNAYQPSRPLKNGGSTAATSVFVTKFSPDGSSLEYSTYLGGHAYDYGYAIAVDRDGYAYVTGVAGSGNFPTTPGAYQTVCSPVYGNGHPNDNGCDANGLTSPFLTKLNQTGTGIVYSTFLNGWGNASANAVAVDNAGRAYIAGDENVGCSQGTTCFPTTAGAVIRGDQLGSGSPPSSFIAAFDATGSQLLYSTVFGDKYGTLITSGFTGGGGATYTTGVAVDPNGYFYLVGYTKAGMLPTTPGAYQTTSGPLQTGGVYLAANRGMVAKFNPVRPEGGSSLAYATYFGGTTRSNDAEFISAVTTDAQGHAYVLGNVNIGSIPTTAGAYQTTCGYDAQQDGCATAFVTKFEPDLSGLVWSTYVGGARADGADQIHTTNAIALDGNGNVYIEGTNNSNLFPFKNAVENPAPGVLVAELDPDGAQLLFASNVGAKGLNSIGAAGLAVDPAGNIYLAGNVNGPDLVTTTGAFQPNYLKATACCYNYSGFVAKISPLIPTTTALNLNPATATPGQEVTFTATVTHSLSPSLTPTGSVDFKEAGGAFLGTGNLDSSGIATYSKSGLSPATYIVTATYSGDDNFMTSTSVPQNLVISGGGSQTITFGALPNVTYGVSPITLNATASSGLAVSYAVTGPALLNGAVLSITGIGAVSVTASQAGNSSYAAAPDVVRSFTVLPAVLTVKATSASIAYGQTPALTYEITGLVNNDTANVLTGKPEESTTATSASAPGTYPITITQGTLSASNYSFAFVNGTLTIAIATQTVTFGALPNVVYGVSPITLPATASSGLAVSYTVTGPATVSGSTLTITGVGTVTVTASQAGNTNYAAAANVQQSFTVSQASQTITFGALPNVVYGVSPITLPATASSGLAVSYTVTGPATVTGSTLTITGVGTVTVTASQAGNTNYAAAASVSRSFQVSQASQTITFYAIPAQVVGARLALTASASSGLTVSFSSLTSSVCSVSGTTANMLAPGTCTIEATQGGNANYLAATSVSQSFQVSSVTAGGFTITVIPPAEIIRGILALFTLDLKSINGVKGTVKLSCSGGPAGTNCDVLPPSIYLNREAFAFAGALFPKTTKAGTYTITFTGTSGSTVVKATAKVTLK